MSKMTKKVVMFSMDVGDPPKHQESDEKGTKVLLSLAFHQSMILF